MKAILWEIFVSTISQSFGMPAQVAVVEASRLSTTDWVMIGTTLFLGAVALYVPYLAEQLKRYLFQPKLEVNFILGPPYCHQTKSTGKIELLTGTTVPVDEPDYYFRFLVSNAGKSQARRCEIVLESIEKEDASGKYRPYHFSPINKEWGSGYAEFIDINPGRKYFCDLFHIPSFKLQELISNSTHKSYVDPRESGSFNNGLVLYDHKFFYSQPNRLPPGRYRFGLSIYSENAKIKRLTFAISWSGNWKTTDEDMFKEAVVDLIWQS